MLTADDVGGAVVELVQHPHPMWIIPWLWSFTVWMSRNLNWRVDYTTMHRFTIPERANEINARGYSSCGGRREPD